MYLRRMRSVMAAATLLVMTIAAGLEAQAQNAAVVEVWKSPFCGCCGKWVAHMKAAGFQLRVHNTQSLGAIKNASRIPRGLRSCHTAKVGGYVIEGHVPAADVKRLLTNKPKVLGIAVPGMPLGSPGMEVPSGEKDAYDVISFDGQGKTVVFAEHGRAPRQ